MTKNAALKDLHDAVMEALQALNNGAVEVGEFIGELGGNEPEFLAGSPFFCVRVSGFDSVISGALTKLAVSNPELTVDQQFDINTAIGQALGENQEEITQQGEEVNQDPTGFQELIEEEETAEKKLAKAWVNFVKAK